MPPRLLREAGRPPLRVQRCAVQVPLQRRVGVGHEVDQAALLVYAADCALVAVAHDHPLAHCEGPYELAIRAIQVQMLETSSPRSPDELRRTLEKSQLLVQGNPGVTELGE